MNLKNIVLTTVLATGIGAGAGGLSGLIASRVVAGDAGREKMQQKLGVTMYNVYDENAGSDFLIDNEMKFVYGGAAVGAIVGIGKCARRKRYYEWDTNTKYQREGY